MKFHKEIQNLFSHDKLLYIADEATLIYTDERDEVDYMLWLRDNKLRAEVRVDTREDTKIIRLDESKEEYYEKDEFLKILKNSKPSKLTYMEVE